VTWVKLSDDFADQCAGAGLSDAAFRTHVEGLSWAMRRETGGHLSSIDLRRAVETPNAAAAVAELLAVGFWEHAGTTGYRVVHHMAYQPEVDVIAKRRADSAERQRKLRRRKAGLPDE
jgi:hypothetical protein